MEKSQYHVLQVTWSHITVKYMLRWGTETLHVKKMADLYSHGKFIY